MGQIKSTIKSTLTNYAYEYSSAIGNYIPESVYTYFKPPTVFIKKLIFTDDYVAQNLVANIRKTHPESYPSLPPGWKMEIDSKSSIQLANAYIIYDQYNNPRISCKPWITYDINGRPIMSNTWDATILDPIVSDPIVSDPIVHIP